MKRGAVDLRRLLEVSEDRDAAKPHEIFVDHDLPRIVDEAIEIMRTDDDVFARGGALVRVRRTGATKRRDRVKREAGSVIIGAYPAPAMREFLIAKTHFFVIEADEKTKQLEQHSTTLPGDVVSTLRARAAWPGVRNLEGIVHAPTLRDDGSILQVPGYDAESELLFDSSGETFPIVPDRPTRAQAVEALGLLLDVVGDVPWASDAHKAAWIACVLTAIGRSYINGCVPLFAIDANIRGAGKSLLADVAAIIATGRTAPRMAQPDADAEARKTITALLMEGERLTLIDNVSRPLGSAALDALLTSELWKDRVLGVSKTVTVANDCVWMATGNNLQFAGDTVRRTLHIRLDSPHENPEDRGDFKYPDLRAHVRLHRGALASAALTILRAFVVANDKPKVRLWGSFEGWSKAIAAACVWVGLPDPQSTRVELEADADPVKAALSVIIQRWPALFPNGSTVKNALDILYPKTERGEDRAPDVWDSLREAIEALAPPPPGRTPVAAKVGYAFRAIKKRVISGAMLDAPAESYTRDGVAVWLVRGMRGIAGDNSLSSGGPSLPASSLAPTSQNGRAKHPPQSPASPAVDRGAA